MLRRWWDRTPGRLEFELQALRDLGVEPAVDDEQRARGRIVISFDYPVDGQSVAFQAVFPALYPHLRFELYAPSLTLKHHQNPFERNLCLIGGSTSNWLPQDTVAGFLTTQLPHVLATGASDDAASAVGVEEPQAEPVTTYYLYEPGSLLLVDSAWTVPVDAQRGELTIGIELRQPLRGAVREVTYASGSQPAAEAIRARGTASARGRWFRMPTPVLEREPTQLLAAVAAAHPEAAREEWQPFDGALLDIVGLIFPEETGWRADGDGWLFIVRRQADARSRDERRRAGLFGPSPRPTIAVARAGRYGPTDVAARVPTLAPLRDRTVALIGIGGVGAPSALDFGRAGLGTLKLVDGDHVEAGTGVRWPIGLDAAGWDKVAVLRDHLARNWPYMRVEAARWRLGIAAIGGDDEMDLLERLLDGSDLLLDATAEPGVQRALADLAREARLPYLSAAGTNGGWGGLVMRLRPDAEACWYCVHLAMADKTILPPPEDPAGGVQPPGCTSPTFTGTSFDLAPVSAMAVRLAVMTLAPDTYGDVDWNVAVLALRDDQGRVLPGSWTTYPAERHPLCQNHAPRP